MIFGLLYCFYILEFITGIHKAKVLKIHPYKNSKPQTSLLHRNIKTFFPTIYAAWVIEILHLNIFQTQQ